MAQPLLPFTTSRWTMTHQFPYVVCIKVIHWLNVHLKASIVLCDLKVLVYIWLLLIHPPCTTICGFSYSVLYNKTKGWICKTWPATAPSIKFHPIEDGKWSRTISVNGLAATDLLHCLSPDLIVHYMMSYSCLIVNGAAPYCHASYWSFPSSSVFFPIFFINREG